MEHGLSKDDSEAPGASCHSNGLQQFRYLRFIRMSKQRDESGEAIHIRESRDECSSIRTGIVR